MYTVVLTEALAFVVLIIETTLKLTQARHRLTLVLSYIDCMDA